MKVAILVGRYLPGYRSGGPIVSINRLVAEEDDHDIRIITRDRDFEDTSPYPGIDRRTWTAVDGAFVAYLPVAPRDVVWVIREMRKWRPDVVYLNGLYATDTLLTLIVRKTKLLPPSVWVLAPRGDTSPGARKLKQRKKRLAAGPIRWLLGDKFTLHASSPLELSEFEDWKGEKGVDDLKWVIRPPSPPKPSALPGGGSGSVTPIVVFASRIDPKKGLDRAIELMARIRVPVTFKVYGTVSDSRYWHDCLDLATSLPSHVEVRYEGAYHPDEACLIFDSADLLVLPTRGENFGHTVAEALSRGCPVAISRGVTLWDPVIRRSGVLLEHNDHDARTIDKLIAEPISERASRRELAWSDYSAWRGGNENERLLTSAGVRSGSLFEAVLDTASQRSRRTSAKSGSVALNQ